MRHSAAPVGLKAMQYQLSFLDDTGAPGRCVSRTSKPTARPFSGWGSSALNGVCGQAGP